MVDMAAVRNIAIRYGVDGEVSANRQRHEPDGYLSVHEIAHGLANLRRLYDIARDPKRRHGGMLPAKSYAKMIDLLVSLLPKAHSIEPISPNGIKIMDEQFYALGLDRAEMATAMRGDVLYGNNDGQVTPDEFQRAREGGGKYGA